MIEASYYEKSTSHPEVRCKLCPHDCRIEDGSTGVCRVRKNVAGLLYAENYEEVVSVGFHRIEELGLFHFRPGCKIMAIGGAGGAVHWDYLAAGGRDASDAREPSRWISAKEVVDYAAGRRCEGIAFTHGEPFVWIEFVQEVARIAQSQGLVTLLVTDGYVNSSPLEEIIPLVSGVNLALQTLDERLHRERSGARLEPILRAATRMVGRVHLEIRHTIVPGFNDRLDDLERLSRWVADNLGARTPFHVCAFLPAPGSDLKPSPVQLQIDAYDAVRENLEFVYLDQVPHVNGNQTCCPDCGEVLVDRVGGVANPIGVGATGRCVLCGLDGVFAY